MKRYKLAAMISLGGYAVALISGIFLPSFISLLIPVLIGFGGMVVISKSTRHRLEREGIPGTPQMDPVSGKAITEPSGRDGDRPQKFDPSTIAVNAGARGTNANAGDPIWDPVHEYISVIEQMVLSEGEKNALDDEIVQKTQALLARITRLIPQLKEMNDGGMNHNIQRLVFKDLNGAINPFLKLSGEAKVMNRRLLLTGLKDINSKLSFYVEAIENKDLIELQTRMDLIQQRYRTTDS
ncbi:hypothetical protein [Paenibacillus pini]|uniref:5-bromo-4-chloroindolyl phosphate hydrolysis protein n=1 Tax=Paenibacillus pini JCM 16418 TaxID=1236976 RepID=W7YEY3_9BACL|nr:hypothetical protein [Paenibacillus pini]GAF09515.1 hypothetical protein JCM16418_3658 [Paenibacillus pini JCM 16418]